MANVVDSAVSAVVSQTGANATANTSIVTVTFAILAATDLSEPVKGAILAVATYLVGGGAMSIIRSIRVAMVEAGLINGAHK